MTDTKLNVLVVDDDTLSRTKLAFALQKLGHTAQKVSSGTEALELLRTTSVDVMLLDLLMPEMDGFDVLRAINNDPAIQPTPTVVVSSLDDNDSIQEALSLGAKVALSKSYTSDELESALNVSLN